MSNKPETQLEGASLNIVEQRKRELKQLFPGVFTETKNDKGELVESIDFERLKAELGEFSEIYDNRRERYGMDWPGKRDCLRLIQEPSYATLKPCREESVDFDTTKNLFIEGDNLEVLKLLQKAYYGKIKMIYIDPPYNTGKEFIYPDNYSESLETYLAYAGLVDDEGKKFSTNTAAEGRFHTKWLNMMYPRLYLARNLLKEDGAIFISIDDNEVENLRRMCNEIFGEENFLAQIAWEKRYTRSNNAKAFYSLKDNIIVYRKSPMLEYVKESRTEKADSNYKNLDNDPKGLWTTSSYVNPATKSARPNLVYTIINPITGKGVDHPTHAWKYSFEEHKKHIEENRLWWGKDGNAQYPRLKLYLSDQNEGLVPIDLWDYKTAGTTDEAGQEIKELFGSAVFDTPKPTKLIQKMLGICGDSEGVVLDFFSGSASLGHAVFKSNIESGMDVKYILVQLPEPCGDGTEAASMGFKSVADIGKARLRKAAKRIIEERSKQFEFDKCEIDLGFKVFKLNKSNFKLWGPPSKKVEEDKLVQQIELSVDHVDPNAAQEDLLYELLLKVGVKLTETIETIELAGHKVFNVGDGGLLIHLDGAVSQALIEAVLDIQPEQFVCLDRAFHGNDQLKANAVKTFEAHNQALEKDDAPILFRTV